jgi:hypothetical protein
LLSACASVEPTTAPTLAAPLALTAPEPIVGNTGRYLSPYTEDGTVALWVEKGQAAGAGASVGGFVGAQAGAKLAENIPFFGAMLGKSLGESAGRAMALQMVGGEAFMRQHSDLSFNSVRELALYLYVTNSGHKDFAKVLELTQQIYPELQQGYHAAIASASAGR